MRVVVAACGGPIADRCPDEHDEQVRGQQVGQHAGTLRRGCRSPHASRSTVPGLRELRLGRDDGSGAVFIGDPTIPVDSAAGVELLAVNAALMQCWDEIRIGRAHGLPVIHHERSFDELAHRQRTLRDAIRAAEES